MKRRGHLAAMVVAVLGASLLAGAVFAVLVSWPGNRADETWMLLVGHRVASGERLYQDVYFVSTPLAAWVVAALDVVVGTSLLAMRALQSVVLIGQVAVALAIARAAEVPTSARLVLVLAILAVGSPMVAFTNLYSMLAVLFGGLAFLAVLRWQAAVRRDATSAGALTGAGLASGLSFAAKPNVGVLVVVALGVAVVLGARSRSCRAIVRDLALVASGATGAIVAAVVVPIAATGAWAAFVDQVFGGKRDYLRVGFSYPEAVERVASGAFGLSSGLDLRSRWRLVVLVTPVLALALFAVALRRASPERRRSVVVATAFGVAGLLSVFPRPGVNHFALAAPLVVTAVAVALHTSAPSDATRERVAWRTVAGLAVGLVLVVGLVGTTADAFVGDPRRAMVRVHHGPLAGTPVPDHVLHRTTQAGHALHSLTDGRVLVVREDAAFWYLTTGIRNPLPYDYPEVSDLGSAGERGVIDRLRRGEARWVCVRPRHAPGQWPPELRPVRLERWVRTHLDLVARLPGCDLHEREPGTAATSGSSRS